MKTNIESILLGACIGVAVTTLLSVALVYESTHTKLNTEPDPSPVIIWNDDTESIPQDGELVRLEMTQNDTIYIGPK